MWGSLIASQSRHKPPFFAVVSCFKVLLAHAPKNGLTAEQLLSVQRSCFLPDARRRPNQLEGGVLRSGRRHSRRQFEEDTDRGEARTHRETGTSIGQNQQCHVEGGGGGGVETASAGEGRGVVSESEKDVLGLVLYYILTGT